jgi:hypothetical protein
VEVMIPDLSEERLDHVACKTTLRLAEQ